MRNSSTKIETFARRMSGTIGREDEVDGAARVRDRDLRLVLRVRGDEDDRRVLALARACGSAAPSRSRPCPASARPCRITANGRVITARSAASPDSASTIVAERLEDRPDRQALAGVVVDHEDRGSGRRRRRRRGRRHSACGRLSVRVRRRGATGSAPPAAPPCRPASGCSRRRRPRGSARARRRPPCRSRR